MAEFVEECAANNLTRGHYQKKLAKCEHDRNVEGFISSVTWFLSGLIVGYAVGK